jgi:cell division protein FtsQ
LDAPTHGRSGVRPLATTLQFNTSAGASGLTPSSATSQRHRRFGLWALAAATFVLVGNPELRAAALGHIERGLEWADLGLQQVTVAGHRYTADTDIYAALDLDNARTLITFDARAAKARLEQLPWVEKASIERIAPDAVEVIVAERTPFALWREGDKHWLIDRQGRKLQLAPANIMPHLPRVAGDGAGAEVVALTQLLAEHPAIARKVELAERVAGRRWALHMAGGLRVELPADGASAALTRLARLYALGLGEAGRIDLRASNRTLIDGLNRTTAHGPDSPDKRS